MPEGFHPTRDMTMRVRREDVPAEVVAYVDGLERQLDRIVARCGIATFRDAMRMPDAERYERLEAVMDLKDLERYAELIKTYRTAVMKKAIPLTDRGWWGVEAARPFSYDKEKARELGFSEIRLKAFPVAQEIIDAVHARDPLFVKSVAANGEAVLDVAALKAVWNTNCAGLPAIGEERESTNFFKFMAGNRLFETFGGDESTNRPHVPRFGTPEFLLVMDWEEFDWDDAAWKSAGVSAETKALFMRLFGREDVTCFSRETVDDGLFSNHRARVPSSEALAVIRDLIGPGQDVSQYELRLIRYDEYVRAAASRHYGTKRLNALFDGYYGSHGTIINGGRSNAGGALSMETNSRNVRREDFVVRLVLSRKA